MAFRVRAGGAAVTGGREQRIPGLPARSAPDAEIRSLFRAYRFSRGPGVIWSRSGGGGPTAAEQTLPLKITGFLAVVILDRITARPIS
jgi:hypothetical protein